MTSLACDLLTLPTIAPFPAARLMVPSADVEDVVADAHFQAWRDAGEFDAQRGSPVTWLLTIVRSRALDLLRRYKASPEVAGADDADGSPADTAGPPDLLAAFNAAQASEPLSRETAARIKHRVFERIAGAERSHTSRCTPRTHRGAPFCPACGSRCCTRAAASCPICCSSRRVQ